LPDWRGLVVPIAAIATAEFASLSFGIKSDALASPHAVVEAFWAMVCDGELLQAVAQTLTAAGGGLMFGVSIGLPLGIGLGLSPRADSLLEITLEAIRPVPSVALIPIVLMIFGFGYRMEIAVVAFTTMWPVLMMTRAAIRGLEPRLVEVSRVLGLTRRDFIRKIVFPAIAPNLFVALRIAAGVALTVAVTVEIAANPIGLGAAIMAAQQALRPESMFAVLIAIGILGLAVNAALLHIQRLFFVASLAD
jgi:NitT/TauT family transport system permease protein